MDKNSRIYLDNNATTALDPLVYEAMQFDFGPIPYNPSAIHSFGRDGRNELTKARRIISASLNIDPQELIFSSGGSESNNFLLHGFFKQIFPKKVISSRIEHSSIYKNIENYAKAGGVVEYLPIGEQGMPMPQDLLQAITSDTGLIVIMAVNNETGVKTDLKAFADIAYKHRVPLIVDGVSLLGKEPFALFEGIAAMSFSAHKLHGPKGIGLTYLNQEYDLAPLILGGGQENGHRAGTHNLAGILGFAKAIELLDHLLPEATIQMQKKRDYFEQKLFQELKDVMINGSAERICNTSNLAFLGLDGESLLMNLDLKGVAASHGSACSSGSLAPSRTLLQMGLSKERVTSSIRFSLSRMTSWQEIDQALSIIIDIVKKMRS